MMLTLSIFKPYGIKVSINNDCLINAMAYVLTDTGKACIVNILRGNPVTYYLTQGSNPSGLTSAATDIALFSEIGPRTIATVSSVTTNTTGDTLQITGSLRPTSNITVGEAGVSDAVTVPVVGILQPSSTVIGSTTGTTVVTNVALTPGNNGYIQIRGEVMQVVSGSGTTQLTVTRSATPLSTIAANDPVAQGNAPGTSNVIGGNLYLKADFTPVPLQAGDALVYTWEVVYQ